MGVESVVESYREGELTASKKKNMLAFARKKAAFCVFTTWSPHFRKNIFVSFVCAFVRPNRLSLFWCRREEKKRERHRGKTLTRKNDEQYK